MIHKNRHFFAPTIISFVISCCLFGCLEADQYAPETVVISQAPGSDETIEAAWRPSALLCEKDGTCLFADQAVRKIRRYQAESGKVETLVSLSGYERDFSVDAPIDNGWGLELREIHGYLLLAGKSRRLCILPRDTLQPFFVGKDVGGTPAEDGIPLGETDFSDLSGFGVDEDNLYLAFNNRIFKVPFPIHGDLDSINQAQLTLIAGNDSGEPLAFGKATDISLTLPSWFSITPMDGETLFFPEKRQLRALRNDKLLSLTGKGSLVGNNIPFEDFYAKYLPSVVISRMIDGMIYVINGYERDHFIKLDIESLDWNKGEAKGTVYTQFSNTYIESIGSFDAMGNNLLFTSLPAGSLIKWDGDSLNAVYGPMYQDSRVKLDDEDYLSHYVLNSLVGPQAIASLYGDRVFVINEPLISRMSLQFHINDEETTTPIWLLSDLDYFDLMTSNVTNNEQLFYAKNGSTLYKILLNEDLTFDTSGILRFFRTPDYLGLPATQDVVHFDTPPFLYRERKGLLLSIPDIPLLVRWNSGTTELNIENSPALGSDVPSPGKYPTSLIGELNLNKVHAFHSLGRYRLAFAYTKNNDGILALGNVSSTDWQSWGITFPKLAYSYFAGAGEIPIAKGIPASQTLLHKVTAIDLTSNYELTIVHQDAEGKNTLWTLDSQSAWLPVAQTCGDLPDGTIQKIRRLNIYDNIVYFIQTDSDYFACNAGNQPTYLAQSTIPGRWSKLKSYVQVFDAYQQRKTKHGSVFIYHEDHSLCLNNVSTKKTKELCTTYPNLRNLNDLSFYESDDELLLAMSATNGENVHVIYSMHINASEEPAYLMGNGCGFPLEIQLNQFYPGNEISSLVEDDSGNLYFAATDTHTIWKVSADETGFINDNATATLLYLGEDLVCPTCNTRLHITPNGTLYASNTHELYTLHQRDKIPVAGGGLSLPSEAFIASELAFEHIIDIASIDNNPCILSTDGLLCIMEDLSILHLTENGAFYAGNQRIDITNPGITGTHMISSLDNRSLYISHFATNGIYQISYQPQK